MAQAEAKKRKITAPGMALILLVVFGGVVWLMRDFASGWSGTVTGKRESGGAVLLEVRDASGKNFETRIPKVQGDEVEIGQQVTKQRFSRAIRFEKVVETTIVE
jgi:hypothetical protein